MYMPYIRFRYIAFVYIRPLRVCKSVSWFLLLQIGDPDTRIVIFMAVENTVLLKLPTFWTSQPEVWFVQTEAQFNLRCITNDDTKYFYVLAALDQSTAMRLLDFINHPLDGDK